MIIKLERYEKNPIMTSNGHKWENLNVSNAGAAVLDGKVYLIYRAEGEERRSDTNSWPVTRLGLAVSENGYDISYRHEYPVFDRDINNMYCKFGCEDPRVSKIGDDYYIVFTGMTELGQTGDFLMYSKTKDFKDFTPPERLMPELEQRTSGLLPGKIDGRFCLFHRPMPNMWVSYSEDLKNWSGSRCILQLKPGSWYEKKLGIGPAPLETPYGWLLFWHGKNIKAEYALGIMLLDKDDPSKIIKFQEEPILTCEMPYEKEGFVKNVIYTNGAVELNGKFFVYYGCCDRCLSVATVDVDEIYRWCSMP
jgi:predicted GH43/DUF377 family glycosyl hydrolase